MWRKKKFIIAVLVVVVLGATLGGVAIARANDDSSNNQTQTATTNLLDKVAEIYKNNTGMAIDSSELQKAFTEARQALQDEALNNYLQKQVTDGKITQDQADQYKTWLKSRPAFPTDEFKQWKQSRPDIPGLNGPGPRGMMPFGGMRDGFGRFGGCLWGR